MQGICDVRVGYCISSVSFSRYFGKNVFQQLGGTVPVGLVSSNVGGTGVQLWSSQDATAKCNQTGVLKQSTLFNSFIEPMLPLQLSGWIWYQVVGALFL